MMKKASLLLILGAELLACQTQDRKTQIKQQNTFLWENATIYFLLADRFVSGDPKNDIDFGRKPDGAHLRNFMEEIFVGIINKIESGYFNDLGVDALWFNPSVEQIHGAVDEGSGKTTQFSATPYVFSRSLQQRDFIDQVVVDIDYDGSSIPVGEGFSNGEEVLDYYSGEECEVDEGEVKFDKSELLLITRK